MFPQNLSPSNNLNLEVLSCIKILTADWRSVPGDYIDFFDLSADWGDFLCLKTSKLATQPGMPEGKVSQNTWTICIAVVNHWSISMSNPLEERLNRTGFKILEIQQQESDQTFFIFFPCICHWPILLRHMGSKSYFLRQEFRNQFLKNQNISSNGYNQSFIL